MPLFKIGPFFFFAMIAFIRIRGWDTFRSNSLGLATHPQQGNYLNKQTPGKTDGKNVLCAATLGAQKGSSDHLLSQHPGHFLGLDTRFRFK